MNKNINCLNMYLGHKVEISTNNFTFHFQNFNYQHNKDYLILSDVEDEYCGVYIPSGQVTDITTLSDDLYKNVVDIKYDNITLSICCAEEPLVCGVCGKTTEDVTWVIEQQTPYGSQLDGDILKVKFKMCDDCFVKLLSPYATLTKRNGGGWNE